MRTLLSTLLFSSMVAMLLGCGGGHLQHQAALSTSGLAVLHNDLPADGCTWVVELDGQRLAPDAASVERIVTFTGGAIGATQAQVTYRLPEGSTTRVECGWGSHQELPTIEVLTLQAP